MLLTAFNSRPVILSKFFLSSCYHTLKIENIPNHSFEHKYNTKKSQFRFPSTEDSSNESIGLSPFYADSRLEIRDIIVEDDSVHLFVQCCNDHGVCPYCGSVSRKVHSKYCRTIVDLPILRKALLLL